MCQSKAQGGRRCATHLRSKFDATTPGTFGWDDVAAEYATTREGRQRLTVMHDKAVTDGNIFQEIACQTALDRGPGL